MILRLSPLPTSLKGPAGDGYHGRVPRRALFLAPDAAASLLALEAKTGGLVYTDIYRSAAESLAARAKKSGVQPPGFSAHGYGLAFDLDLGESMRRLKTSYPKLRELLETYGWWCHRRDLESRESEAWHFNFLGEEAEKYARLADPREHGTWARPVERVMLDRYGKEFVLTKEEIATNLAKLGQDLKTFQASWGLTADGVAGPKTQRTLAYVSATVSVEALG